VKAEMLPPNYSHLLQPLDFSLNASIKYVYRLEHAHWLLRAITATEPTGLTADNPTVAVEVRGKGAACGRKRRKKRKRGEPDPEPEPEPDTRRRAATEAEVEVRVATAVYALAPQHIRRSWAHTLNGMKLLAAAIAAHDERVKNKQYVRHSADEEEEEGH
jgi:hypothetical protein